MMDKASGLSSATRELIQQAQGYDEPTAADASRVKAKWLSAVAAGGGIGSLAEGGARTTIGKAAAGKAASSGSQWALWSGAGLAALGIGAGIWSFASSPAQHMAPKEQAAAEARLSANDSSASPVEEPGVSKSLTHREGSSPLEKVLRPSQPAPSSPAPAEVAEPVAVGPSAEAQLVAEPATAQTTKAPLTRSEGRAVQRSVPAPKAPPPLSDKSRTQPPRALLAQKPEPIEPPRAAAAQAPPAPTSEPGATASALPGSPLRQEIALLKTARELLGRGQARAAMGVLDQYSRRFSKPVLGAEASALRVDALCAGGQRQAARAEAQRFLERWGRSPLAQRVSAACAE